MRLCRAALLKKLGFGATFFITEGFDFPTNKTVYMTWEEIAALDKMGFEIGNHTAKHANAGEQTREAFTADLEVDRAPLPGAWHTEAGELRLPGQRHWWHRHRRAKGEGLSVCSAAALRNSLIKADRALPSIPRSTIRSPFRQPETPRPAWKLEDFVRAVSQAKGGKIAVLQFHGVPDREHPWVSTEPELFENYMTYLRDNGYKVIALSGCWRST